ncbi:MAG: hypothetical protein ACLFQV_01735 [Vulcanimicrobiota bacterium]
MRKHPKVNIGLIILAGLILIGGIGFFAYNIFTGIQKVEKGMSRVEAPGEATVVLEKTGTYTVFHEYVSNHNGRVYNVQNLPPFKMVLQKNSQIIETRPANMSSNYNIGGRSGRAVLQFSINEPGTYKVVTTYEGDGPATIFSITQSFMSDLMITVFSSIGVLFVAIIAPMAMIAIVIVKYLKEKKEYEKQAETDADSIVSFNQSPEDY